MIPNKYLLSGANLKSQLLQCTWLQDHLLLLRKNNYDTLLVSNLLNVGKRCDLFSSFVSSFICVMLRNSVAVIYHQYGIMCMTAHVRSRVG